MAKKINYRVHFELAGGAKVTKTVQAANYLDLVKKVKKTYNAKIVLSVQEV